jgi:2,3-dihydroxybenzoate-AMP ligase
MNTREPRLVGAVAFPREFAEAYRASGLWEGESFGTWFRARAQRFADRTAIVDGPVRLSYRELGQRVHGLALVFRELGIAPLDRVVLQLPNSADMLEVLLSLLYVGAVPVLALPAHRRVELESFCLRADASALILDAQHRGSDMLAVAAAVRESCPELGQVIVRGNLLDFQRDFTSLLSLQRRAESASGTLPEIDASEVALLQLSGGSTGIPKLIPRTHDDYLYSVRASAALCGLSEHTRYLAALPMSHNFTLSSPGVLGTLHLGGCVVSCPHPSPEVVFGLLVNEGITITSAVPSLARAWLDARTRYARSLELGQLTLQVGGAKLDEALARSIRSSLGCKLQQVFGMAEGLVNYTRLDARDELVLTTQGRPLSPFDEVRVVDPLHPESDPLPPGVVGELQTRGPYTFRGYYDDRANDARHFTSDGFYRTGDLVRRSAEGDLTVEGRLGERILRAGEKIAPEEVEQHIRAHPLVRDAAVVGLPDLELGQRSHAFVVLEESRAKLTMPELRGFLRQRGLADFKLPDAVHLVDDLPRTMVGKTDKTALKKGASAR